MACKEAKTLYTEVDQIADRKKFLESARKGFCDFEDPREKGNQTYPLVHLLVMMLCAVLAGANTIADIHRYAKLKLRILQKNLKI